MSRLSHWDALRRDSGNVLQATRSSDEQTDSPELKRPQPVAPPEITTAHVDEAVEISLNEHVRDPGTQDAVKRLMQIDPNSAAAHAYYTSQAAQARMRAVPNTARKGVSIPHVLSDDAVKVVTEYAPEFKVNFSSNVSHDHPLAAATRILDHELVYARIPPGVTVGDIGGNPLFHVRRGIEDVHVCGPKYDRKDASRHLQRHMRVRQMLRDGSLSDVSAKLAAQYLEQRATKFACGQLAEHCYEQATVLTSIHVYDIALESWPLIMSNKNARVVEGVMLFSSRMFERKNGEFPSAGARYEVDMDQDTFRLGFVDSSAWWYEHNLTQYLKYGADQLISYQGQCYSYKIVERRGDTIFFRILKVPSVPYPEYSQYYMMPDIQTVEVRSFALTRQSAKYKKTRTAVNTYYKPIWDELYSQAANDIERGVFDLARVANHYRTVIVRSTINSVVVSGGMTAAFGEETQMMVDVSLAAMADIYLGQRETLAMTRTIEAHRNLRSEATLTKVFSALVDAVKGLGFVLVLPFVALARFVDAAAGKVLSEHVVEWTPEVMIKRINVRHIMNAKNLQSIMREQSYDTWAKEYGETYAPLDHVAAAKRSPHIMGLLQQVCPELAKETGATTSQSSEPAVALSAEAPPPSYHTKSQVVAPSQSDGKLLELTDEQREERHTVRLAAIKEAIVEAEMESVATSSSCARAYREMAPNGKPVKALIEKFGEQYGASDFWYVENGIFEYSFLGLKPDDYRHAAAYHPVPQTNTTRCERVAYRRSYKAKVDDRLEVREYLLLDEEDFTGWLFTCDLLLIFNGPEILATLRESLKVRHDYDIHLYQGPPGCGKTYQIIQKFDPKQPHGLFCPVRESIQDTRGQVQKKWGKISDLKVRARTVDSFLVNWQSQDVTRNLTLNTAFFDECFMTSYGKAAALFGLLGVEHVHAYGDRFQIPHIPRVQAPSLYVRMRADITHTEYVTRRCPADAVAAWGDIYEWRVRTASTVSESMKVVTTTEGLAVPKGCVMMAMYQADKVVLRSRYAKLLKTGAVTVDSVEDQVTNMSQRVAKVLTAHEAEGKTYDDVWLHRFDARQRSDGRSLFDRQEHVLVAMSRHRNSFVYVCPTGVTDMVKRRIAQGSDVRRIEAAADLATAGESVEKL